MIFQSLNPGSLTVRLVLISSERHWTFKRRRDLHNGPQLMVEILHNFPFR